jgi:hypothetical protein
MQISHRYEGVLSCQIGVLVTISSILARLQGLQKERLRAREYEKFLTVIPFAPHATCVLTAANVFEPAGPQQGRPYSSLLNFSEKPVR